jgi:hypothetical protein
MMRFQVSWATGFRIAIISRGSNAPDDLIRARRYLRWLFVPARLAVVKVGLRLSLGRPCPPAT